MTTLAFDTLKFARALRDKAKLTNEQAEGFADAMAEVLQDDLATKADILTVKADILTVKVELQADIKLAKAELEAKIEAVKSEIIKWMFGTIGFQTLIILGTVIALARVMK